MYKEQNSFQKSCQAAISRIKEDELSNFYAAKGHKDRIETIFPHANLIPVATKRSDKNLDCASEKKINGNKLFGQRKFQEAIDEYNQGIIKCPHIKGPPLELLAILVANRSASFFELGYFKNVLDDIDYILILDSYPKHLLYKIWIRKARCYEGMYKENQAEKAYKLALEYLTKHGNLEEKELKTKIEEIEKNKGKFDGKEVIKTAPQMFNEVIEFDRHYIAANVKVSFNQDETQGKFAVANSDISCGSIIIQENPHCCVLSPENALKNCQHCLKSTKQIFPCPTCSSAVFCSIHCENAASKTYHKYECSFMQTFYASGASINCGMALRMITQKSLDYFKKKQQILEEFLMDNSTKNDLKPNPYTSNDYYTAFFLCRNEKSRKKEELIHFSCMAVYLLNILKKSSFFSESNDEFLTEDQAFIAALILRHLEILQFNAHEISELRLKNCMKQDYPYYSECIGGGLYPTGALFNHSCDPSVVRYNNGTQLIVRAIKPIRKGDAIYENYGPIYSNMKKEFRQQFLVDRYWFDCLCRACQEDWPLLEDIDENVLMISCEKCEENLPLRMENMDPFKICTKCGFSINLMNVLKKFMPLDAMLNRAEELFNELDYVGAMKCFVEALEVLHAYSKGPSPDLIKIKQRLRTCMVHLGNKQV